MGPGPHYHTAEDAPPPFFHLGDHAPFPHRTDHASRGWHALSPSLGLKGIGTR